MTPNASSSGSDLDRRLVAGRELPVGRPDLPDGQPAAAGAAALPSTSSRACSAIGARRPGLNLVYVHASRVIKARDLDAIWIVGPGHGGPAAVANAYLEGTAGEVYPALTLDDAGHAATVPPVLVPRRHRQPRHARDAGLDPRGRRARLRPRPRVRRRLRQPGPRRLLRRRRRRGRDRTAGRELALEQVPQPGGRRGGGPDPRA